MTRTLVAVAVLGLALPVASANAQLTIVPDTSRAIHVTGRSSVSVVPDIATVELGVFATEPRAPQAKAIVDQTIARILELARRLELPEATIRTAAINIEPRYGDGDAPKLLGYEATRSVTVVLRDLGKLDALLDGAVAAGANRNFSIDLTSSRYEELKSRAVGEAVDAAKAQAQSIVERLGARLGPVRSITLDAPPGTTSYSSAANIAYRSAKFLPGDLRIDAAVQLVFVIEDAPAGPR